MDPVGANVPPEVEIGAIILSDDGMNVSVQKQKHWAWLDLVKRETPAAVLADPSDIFDAEIIASGCVLQSGGANCCIIL